MLTKIKPASQVFEQNLINKGDGLTSYLAAWLDWNEDISDEILNKIQSTANLNKFKLAKFFFELANREILTPYGGTETELAKVSLLNVDWVAIAANYLS